MLSKSNRKLITHFGMPILFTILGFSVLFIAGKPLFPIVESYSRMVITKGAPSYPNEFDPEVSKLAMAKESTPDKYEIQVPALETHYANIKCDSIKMEAPVYYGDSDTVFKYGVGQYVSSGLPGEGKPILIGGHDVTYFAELEQIKTGDVVTIETNYGKFEYKVASTKVANAADSTAYDLDQKKEQLILYTCYPFGQVVGERNDRFFVYCDRVGIK